MPSNSQNQKKSAPFPNDAELRQYFNTLPASVQETLVQSGVQVQDLQELKQCAEKFIGKA